MDNTDKYSQWCKNISKGVSGEHNSQYGVSIKNRMKTEEGYERFCKSCSRGTGSDNPNAKAIIMWNNEITLEFGSLTDCAQYLIQNNYTANKQCATNIGKAIANNKPYMGFNFKKKQ